MSRRAIASNPFYVLELEADCGRIEIERQGQKLLAMLEVGLAEAASYPTPFGREERTPEAVREAMAALRDPRRRLVAELWARARLDPAPPLSAVDDESEPGSPGWPGAMSALGWGPPGRRTS